MKQREGIELSDGVEIRISKIKKAFMGKGMEVELALKLDKSTTWKRK